MKPRDVILEQLHHQQTESVPYTLGYEDVVAERLDKHYGGPQWRERLRTYMQHVRAIENARKVPTDEPGLQRDLYGSVWRTDRRPFHLERPALPKATFDGYRWPDPKEFRCSDSELKSAQEFTARHKAEHFMVASLGWGLFETSWGMRGFENALMDVAAEPDFYEELLDRITNHFLAYVEHTCSVLPDIDAIMLGDDWGDQRGVIVGPKTWRAMFKPRYAKIYQAIHARGKKVISHCCGSITEILPDIIEIGLDVIESVQPEARGMNPYELKKRFGTQITFWGGLGSQSTIPFGTPEQIRCEVRRLKKEMGIGGGYILSPAKPLQPETTVENAAAVVEAFSAVA